MSNKRLWLALAILIPLGLFVAAGWRVYVSSRPVATLPLEDGTVLKIYGPIVGREHMDPFVPAWVQLFHRLPPKLRPKLKVPQIRRLSDPSSPDVDTLSLWILHEGNTEAPANPWSRNFRILIGDGISYMSNHSSPLIGTNGRGWNYEGQVFRAWPRQSPGWDIRILAESHPQIELASVEIPNPVRDTKTKVWRASTGPVTRVQEGMEFVLKSVHVGKPGDHDSDGQDKAHPNNLRTELLFDIRKDGQRHTNWVSYHVTSMEDAFGNRSDGNHWSHGWKGEQESYISFAKHPLPMGGAWRMQVEFIRQADFPPESIWRFKRIPLNPRQSGRSLESEPDDTMPSWVVEQGGRRLELLNLRHRSGKDWEVEFTIDPPLKEERIRMLDTARGDGKKLNAHGWGGGSGQLSFYLNGDIVETEDVTADFTLAIHPSIFVEFLIEPQPWTASETESKQ